MSRYCLCLLLAAVFGAQAAPLLTTVDRSGFVGMYTSMRQNQGAPVISYYDASQGDLKLATCTALCDTASPTWVVTTVDRGGDVGWYSSLDLKDGAPVIAYYDVTGGALKLATCTGGCATASPTWIVTTVDESSADTGRFPSLRIALGNPVIAYRDRTNGDLKLATCTAGCATAAPSWLITTVDSAGDVGRFTAMELDSGRPVIAYFDFSNGAVKLATCTGGCSTASPSWVFSVIDTVPGDTEVQMDLQLNGGNPIVSYPDVENGDLKVATCVSGCATSAASWQRGIVDRVGNAGAFSSLSLHAGRPVVAYHGSIVSCTNRPTGGSCHEASDLRLAICTADCASASPLWTITTLDNTGMGGLDPSLAIVGSDVLVSYHDMLAGSLKVARAGVEEASTARTYTGLWWNFNESGWGINISHQGNTVFATLFTYDSSGNPMWLVMSAGSQQSPGVFSGELYRTTGPAFNAAPFTPIGAANITLVGGMTLAFAGDTAQLSYSVSGASVGKTIRRQVFGAASALCGRTTAERRSLTNYQDLWWNAAESGWGINLTHQGDTLFGTLFTYEASGRAVWFVMSSGARQPDGSYLGDLYRTRGSAFNSVPFNPITAAGITRVGTMRLRFAHGEAGTLSYTVDGTSVEKAIVRQEFSSPLSACRG